MVLKSWLFLLQLEFENDKTWSKCVREYWETYLKEVIQQRNGMGTHFSLYSKIIKICARKHFWETVPHGSLCFYMSCWVCQECKTLTIHCLAISQWATLKKERYASGAKGRLAYLLYIKVVYFPNSVFLSCNSLGVQTSTWSSPSPLWYLQGKRNGHTYWLLSMSNKVLCLWSRSLMSSMHPWNNRLSF